MMQHHSWTSARQFSAVSTETRGQELSGGEAYEPTKTSKEDRRRLSVKSKKLIIAPFTKGKDLAFEDWIHRY